MLTKVNINYNDMIQKVDYLYRNRGDCKIGVKIIDFNLSKMEKEKFHNDFNEICDFISIDQPSGWSLTGLRDFTLGSTPSGYLDLPVFNKKEICPLPFFTLSINFNGEVSICCVDWAHKTVVGDLNNENLYDIWYGDRLFKFRKMHLTGRRRENEACSDCFAINGSIDNLDAHAKEILRRIEISNSIQSPNESGLT
jgi:radical SAM protein with 4Fe4S-binding SPASM domain